MIQFTANEELLKSLKYNKIQPQNYKPAYNGESVGLDFYLAASDDIVIPPSRYVYQSMSDDIWVDWNGAVKLPTGLMVVLPPNHGGFVWQRGSITSFPKTQLGNPGPGSLIHQAGCIDPGYTNEIFIPVLNLSNNTITIPRFAKLPFQLVVMPCVTQYCFVDNDNYNTSTRHAKRKKSGFGSSD